MFLPFKILIRPKKNQSTETSKREPKNRISRVENALWVTYPKATDSFIHFFLPRQSFGSLNRSSSLMGETTHRTLKQNHFLRRVCPPIPNMLAVHLRRHHGGCKVRNTVGSKGREGGAHFKGRLKKDLASS